MVAPRGGLNDRARRYIEKAVASVEAEVATAPGSRNETLNRASFRYGRMIQAGWISEEDACVRLTQAAELCGLLKDDGPRQVAQTIRSGMLRGMVAKPAFLPDELAGADLSGFDIRPLSPEVIAAALAVEEQRRQLEVERALDAANQMLSGNYFERVAAALHRHADALAELGRRGITEEVAARFGLGFDSFPLADAPEKYGPPGRRPSLVFPWPAWGREGLDAVQYRHLDGMAPKVHWHHDLHSPVVFNHEAMTNPRDSELFVVEGALNALSLISAGIESVVALPTVRPRADKVAGLAERMSGFDRVYWCADRGAAETWRAFAAKVPDGRGKVATLQMDPDDLLAAFGGDVDRWYDAVRA